MYSHGLDARVRDAAPDHLFARAMAVNTAGLMTLQGIGFAAAGAVAEVTGPATAIAIAGACGLVAVIALLGRLGERRVAQVALEHLAGRRARQRLVAEDDPAGDLEAREASRDERAEVVG
jgi:hypothetical protein